MSTANGLYASGNWVVSSGCEEEFIHRWTEFLGWTRSSFTELHAAQLIQDADDSRHFISFASWGDEDAMRQWRSRPEFSERLDACRALCDEFRGSSYRLAAVV